MVKKRHYYGPRRKTPPPGHQQYVTNPVCARRINLLVCSLPLHRHSYIGFIFIFPEKVKQLDLCGQKRSIQWKDAKDVLVKQKQLVELPQSPSCPQLSPEHSHYCQKTRRFAVGFFQDCQSVPVTHFWDTGSRLQ